MNDCLRHLQDMEIRKDIRAREKEKDKRKEYKDFSWSDIITDGKLSKLGVRDLDLYLTQHGLNTTQFKPDKVKAISCHYFREKWLRTDGQTQGGEVISDGDENDADENETTSVMKTKSVVNRTLLSETLTPQPLKKRARWLSYQTRRSSCKWVTSDCRCLCP